MIAVADAWQSGTIFLGALLVAVALEVFHHFR